MIRQFTYTASPWGKTGAGWMVFQQSRNLPPEAAKALYPIYRYEGEPDSAGSTGSQVQFAYLPSETDEGAILAQTTFTGTRWFDPRPGDFFAHVFLLDKEAVLQSAVAGINPVRLFQSPGLQSAFPETLKSKALKIFRKEIAWEPPPELPEGTSLAAMPANPSLSFETIVGRLSGRSASKLGAIIRAVMLRAMGKGGEPVVFDARNAVCPSIMALVLDFLPPTWRARTWFAVQFRESALRRLPAFQSLSFYGTETNRPSEPDTGVVSGVDFSQDPFRFRNMEEVCSFKRQLDILGQEVSLDAYKGLLACWEVVSGRVPDVRKLREAVKFAEQFPGLNDKMAEGLASAFAGGWGKDGGNAIVLTARFELGMGAVGNAARTICRECARDRLSFAGALQVLEGAGPKLAFLDEVYEVSNAVNGLPGLAAMWMGCGPETKRLVPVGGKDRSFGRFTALVDRFAGIRGNAAQKMVADEHAEGMLDEVEQAERVLGQGFEGMEATQRELRYLVARRRVKGIGDLKTFAKEASSLGIAKDRVRGDGLKKVPLGRIPADQLEVSVAAFGAIGVTPQEIIASLPDDRLLGALDALVSIGANRDEIIRRALAAAEKAEYNRGYERGRRDAQQRAEEEARERNRGHVWGVLKRILIVAALMVLCFAAGYGLRCLTGKAGEETVEGMEASGEVVSGTVTEVGMVGKAIAVQPTDEPSSTPIPPGKEPAPRGGTAPVTEKEPGESPVEYGQGVGRVESQKVPEGRVSPSSAQGNGSSPSARSLRETDAATGRKPEGVPPPVPKPIQERGESIGGAVSAGGIPAVTGESAVAGKGVRESDGARLREVREAAGGGNPYGKSRMTQTEGKTSPGE